jgi:hypothetical protein
MPNRLEECIEWQEECFSWLEECRTGWKDAPPVGKNAQLTGRMPQLAARMHQLVGEIPQLGEISKRKMPGVPGRRRIRHFDISHHCQLNVHTCGWLGKKGMFGARHRNDQAWKMGQSIKSMGAVQVEVPLFFHRAITPSKRALVTFFHAVLYHIFLYHIFLYLKWQSSEILIPFFDK